MKHELSHRLRCIAGVLASAVAALAIAFVISSAAPAHADRVVPHEPAFTPASGQEAVREKARRMREAKESGSSSCERAMLVVPFLALGVVFGSVRIRSARERPVTGATNPVS